MTSIICFCLAVQCKWADTIGSAHGMPLVWVAQTYCGALLYSPMNIPFRLTSILSASVMFESLTLQGPSGIPKTIGYMEAH